MSTERGSQREFEHERSYRTPSPGLGADEHTFEAIEERFGHAPRGRPAGQRTGELLGWLSIGLGVTALLAPRAVSRAAGMAERPLLLRAVGARELVSGVGLLTQRQRTPWLWSRVLGDACDVALLGSVALRPGAATQRPRALGALALLGAIAAVDVMASVRHSRGSGAVRSAEHQPRTGEAFAPRQWPGQRRGRAAFAEQAIMVGKSPQECYAFFRDFRNLPRFIPMLESVTMKDDRTSHWVARLRGLEKTVEWDALITADREGERIAWHSVPGSAMHHAGTVRFEPAPGGRGCIVRVLVHVRPPLGLTGRTWVRAVGRDPNTLARENLRRFKQLLETGEIATTRGQPSGRRSWKAMLTRTGRREARPEGRKARPSEVPEEVRH